MNNFLFDMGSDTETIPKKVKPPKKIILDITANRHKGNEQSVEAFKSSADGFQAQLHTVIEFIASKETYGATSEEATLQMNLLHQAASARFSEAKAKGLIVQVPYAFRLTQSQRRAAVFVTPEVYAAMQAREVGAQFYWCAEVNADRSKQVAHLIRDLVQKEKAFCGKEIPLGLNYVGDKFDPVREMKLVPPVKTTICARCLCAYPKALTEQE